MLDTTSIAQCVLQLVSNSLNAGATAIAIRIHRGERKIQVVDNGKGILKKDLEEIAEYDKKFMNRFDAQALWNQKGQALVNIRRFSDALMITSRYYNSSRTYMKIFKVCHDPKVVKIERRPSQGTTVSIYGFHELSLKKWDLHFMYNLIANIAIANIFVSFSVRDDQEKKITMAITKPHNPIDIFKLLYHKQVLLHKIWYLKSIRNSDIKYCMYIGRANARQAASQHIFLNNKIVHCPVILEVISTTFINTLKFFRNEECKGIVKRGAVFILLFIWCTEYIYTIDNGKRTLILPNVQCLLHHIRCNIIHIFTKNIMPISVSCSKRNYNNFVVNCTRDTMKLYRRTLVQQQLLIPKGNYMVHTFCRVAKKKVTKLNINSETKIGENRTIVPRENATALFTPISQANKIDKEIAILTLSEWSNWTPPDSKSRNSDGERLVRSLNQIETNSPRFYKRFDFLPEKLHKLLRGNAKLTRTDILNECSGSGLSSKLKFGLPIPDVLNHQVVDVRPCKTAKRFHEIMLHKELLKFVKVLGQMNCNFIVGLLNHNNNKVLLVMDQHAIHERIRYEELLNRYKSEVRDKLFCVKLKEPVIIKLPKEDCNLLISNEETITRYGVVFNVLNDGSIIVYAVPECLRKNKYQYDRLKVKLAVKSLLNELLQDLNIYGSYQTNILPQSIYSALATEACHGAITFGDELTLKECKLLLKLLIETKIPTQCAHGRPSIVPVIELNDLEKRHRKVAQAKLNFKSLKLRREE